MSTLKVAAINNPSASSGGLAISASGNVTGAGLDLITTQSFSAVSSVSINNCFSATYDNYRVLVRVNASTGSDVEIRMRMRSSGSDNSASSYGQGILGGRTSDGNVSSASINNGTYFQFGKTPTGGGEPNCLANIDVSGPALSINTVFGMTGFRMANGSDLFGAAGGGLFNATTAFDGFSLYPASGTVTGTVSVYGYKK